MGLSGILNVVDLTPPPTFFKGGFPNEIVANIAITMHLEFEPNWPCSYTFFEFCFINFGF